MDQNYHGITNVCKNTKEYKKNQLSGFKNIIIYKLYDAVCKQYYKF